MNAQLGVDGPPMATAWALTLVLVTEKMPPKSNGNALPLELLKRQVTWMALGVPLPESGVKVHELVLHVPNTMSVAGLIATAPPMALFAWPHVCAALWAVDVPPERAVAPAIAAASAVALQLRLRQHDAAHVHGKGDHPEYDRHEYRGHDRDRPFPLPFQAAMAIRPKEGYSTCESRLIQGRRLRPHRVSRQISSPCAWCMWRSWSHCPGTWLSAAMQPSCTEQKRLRSPGFPKSPNWAGWD